MVHERDDVVGMDGSILMHPAVWKASGHVDTFADPMVDCLLTHKRFRADQIEPQSGIVYHFSGVQDDSYNYYLHSEEFKNAIDGWDDAVARHGHERPSAALDELVSTHLRTSSDPVKQNLGKSFLDASRSERMQPIPYAVLLPPGKPREYARKIAEQCNSGPLIFSVRQKLAADDVELSEVIEFSFAREDVEIRYPERLARG